MADARLTSRRYALKRLLKKKGREDDGRWTIDSVAKCAGKRQYTSWHPFYRDAVSAEDAAEAVLEGPIKAPLSGAEAAGAAPSQGTCYEPRTDLP